MREELCVARRADVDAFDRGDAGVAQDSLRDRPEVEVAPAYRRDAEARTVGGGDLLAHFVAARPDSGPDACSKAPVAECRDTRFEDALEQSEATRVQQRERRLPAAAYERNRQAIR